MYKLIASDLDETLLRKDKHVSKEDAEAIQAFTQAGGIFVCCTGRPYWTAKGTLQEIGQYGHTGTYVISFNGGAITENGTDELLSYAGITNEEAEAMYQAGRKYDVCQHIYTLDTVWVSNINQGEIDYLNGRQAFTEFDHEDLSFLKGQNIVKCLYENTDYAYLRKIAEEVSPLTGNMDVSYSSNRYLEFNRKGVNKGSGLKKLADMLNIDIKDTIAVGDNFNDLAMIQAAGLGIGVANTNPDMKKDCDVILKHSCEESAIAEVIWEYAMKDEA